MLIFSFAIVSPLFCHRKMSPNRVFDRSFDIIRQDEDVQRRYGSSLKAYGRDHGGHREGRRRCSVQYYVQPRMGLGEGSLGKTRERARGRSRCAPGGSPLVRGCGASAAR